MTAPAPFTFPPADPNELARRLDLEPVSPDLALLLVSCLDRSAYLVQPYVDEARVTSGGAGLDVYLEAVYQLAVKDWQIGVQGVNAMDPEGEYTYVPGATAGLVKSVWAYIAPLTTTGGLTV